MTRRTTNGSTGVYIYTDWNGLSG
uniref:Uncharacterized protein n=1 Tax=Arundo donax TaxID=35708 RepID=A0A0A9C6T1_ARUDO